jgi:type II secretory pathway pseudopilin PulG
VEAEVAGAWLRKRNGFTAIDAAITICLAGVLIGIVIPKFQRVAHEAQEVALKSALRNIRTSIKLFKEFNERNPKSLNELIEKEVILPARIGNDPYTSSIFKDKYLMAYAVDGSGNLIDAFGNPFIYDLRRGEVRATTKGYETW